MLLRNLLTVIFTESVTWWIRHLYGDARFASALPAEPAVFTVVEMQYLQIAWYFEILYLQIVNYLEIQYLQIVNYLEIQYLQIVNYLEILYLQIAFPKP